MKAGSHNSFRPRVRAVVLALGALQSLAFAANPFLPSYEYIPDGEPHVYEDRIYLYGSHDKADSERFCDHVLKVWSAPLSDPNAWEDHGIVLSTRDVDGHKDDISWSDDEFYAPDIVKVKGRYYLFAQIVGAPCAVAVSDTPSGPFKVLGQIKKPEGSPMDFAGWSQYFDPGLLLDDDGKVYLYWGFGKSFVAQLNPDNMTEILPGTYRENIIPKEEPFRFFEACSPRKINGVYYIVYANGGELAYVTGNSPTGPFKYGGIIVGQDRDAHGGNIHGGLANVNGQWHIFYHRMTNNTVYSRRACTERVTIEPDGSIKRVEQTSLGFEKSLNPYKITPADIACVFRGGSYVTELDKRTHPVMGNKNGCVVGYKYFDFGGTSRADQKTTFKVQFRDAEVSGKIEVWIGDPQGGGEKIGEAYIEHQKMGGAWRVTTIPVRNITGRHAVFLKFVSESQGGIADLRSFVFTRDVP